MTTKIMIVDDHPIFILGLASLINNEADLEVCAEAIDELSAICQMNDLSPDLIILDLSLGKTSGLQLIKKIRSVNAQVKILVASMHDEKLYAERTIRAGANGYIGKQEAPSLIIQAIHRVLEGQLYLSKKMANQLLSRQLHSGSKTLTDKSPEEGLSDREMEVFRLLGQGLTTKKIADEMNLSVKTIDTYKEHIKRKLALKDNSKLVQRAVAWFLSESPV